MKALSVAVVIVGLLALAGCSYRQYDFGAEVQAEGLTATLYVMRWEVVGSGAFARPDTYSISWGDGTVSSHRDGTWINTYWRWRHEYANPGQYTITVSGSGTAIELSISVE